VSTFFKLYYIIFKKTFLDGFWIQNLEWKLCSGFTWSAFQPVLNPTQKNLTQLKNNNKVKKKKIKTKNLGVVEPPLVVWGWRPDHPQVSRGGLVIPEIIGWWPSHPRQILGGGRLIQGWLNHSQKSGWGWLDHPQAVSGVVGHPCQIRWWSCHPQTVAGGGSATPREGSKTTPILNSVFLFFI